MHNSIVWNVSSTLADSLRRSGALLRYFAAEEIIDKVGRARLALDNAPTE
jgi:hypothetical protein